MSLHCSCWLDGEPCCWCLDDTEEVDGGPELPPCVVTRHADCVTDLRDELHALDDRLAEAVDAKSKAASS